MDPVQAGAFIDGSTSSSYSNIRFLGVRLKKFCLWHQFLLKTVESPFMSKGAVTMRDLRIVAGICRLSPFQSRIRKPWLVPCLIYTKALFAPRRRRKPTAATLPESEDLNALQWALRKQADAFLSYCQDYLQSPEYSIIPPQSAGRAIPPPQTRRGKLDDCIEHAGELITWGIPEQRAWSMPVGMANTYRILARRAAGNDVDVITEEERAFMEQLPPEFRVAK